MRCQCGPRMHGGGMGMGQGMGGGRGRGMGMGGRGMGRGMRHGMGGGRLQMRAGQMQQTAEADSGFEAETGVLRGELLAARQKLADGLEDGQVGDEELLGLAEEMIGAYRKLEKRVLEHVLVLRKVLDADQRMPLIDWRELRQYRDLFYFLVWRDVKTRYAQSVLGVGWAVVQPVFSMIVFTIRHLVCDGRCIRQIIL